MLQNKRKSIPKIARKERSIRLARKLIIDSGINWLPVNPFELYEMHGWILLSWGEARELLNDDDPLRLKKSRAEARTSIIRGSNDYITVYDETIEPFQRIRWTIAHEIGHIVLGHLHDFDKTAINRGGLNSSEYEVLEKEADFFASELLAPMGVLKSVGAINSNDIQLVCNISKRASLNRERDIKWWGSSKIAKELDTYLKNKFAEYLKPISLCINPVFLPFSVNALNTNYVEVANMAHNYVSTDAHGRFNQCPRCGNFDFSPKASYCKMCGLHLYNNCSNNRDYNNYDDYCGVLNPGDARYCEQCGQETTLLRLGLLKTWQELLKSDSTVAVGIDFESTSESSENKSNNNLSVEDPFADSDRPINISDDDLPF